MQPNEAPKFMVHTPQAEPQSAPHPDNEAQVTLTHHDNTVTIKAGDTTAIVEHGTGTMPQEIHVQFPPDMDVPSMMVNVTLDSFQVNLDHALDHDVNFIWSVS